MVAGRGRPYYFEDLRALGWSEWKGERSGRWEGERVQVLGPWERSHSPQRYLPKLAEELTGWHCVWEGWRRITHSFRQLANTRSYWSHSLQKWENPSPLRGLSPYLTSYSCLGPHTKLWPWCRGSGWVQLYIPLKNVHTLIFILSIY